MIDGPLRDSIVTSSSDSPGEQAVSEALPTASHLPVAATTPVFGAIAQPVSPAPATHNLGDSDDGLLPVRMLNEFAYCPRLAYLEHVQGEWADNIETLQGTFGHRNVDKPDRKNFAAPAQATATSDAENAAIGEDKLHARSVSLSAPREGLVAKLDLLEIDGGHATPVDYKRGAAPDLPEGAYEPERVQLCAQGLILRENGYLCTEGVIYFIASRRRVTISFDDALIARTRELVSQFKTTAASGLCPPPLVDSPKCPRCSLVGICLPDETNFLLHQLNPPASSEDREDAIANASARPPKDGLRKLLPARDNALPLYVKHQGAVIGKSGERITVKLKGEEIASVRLLDISQVSVYGSVMFSAQALQELTNRGVPICHHTYGGWLHSFTTGPHHKNIELRIQQFAIAADASRSLAISRQFIIGKIKNSRTLLRRHLPDPGHPALRQLAEYAARAKIAGSAESLLGLEGMAAKEYFAAFFTLLPDRPTFDIDGRNRRPPRDPVNAVLSFVYSLLTRELAVAVRSVGFDPMLGFFHKPRYGRPSLALDVAEEFRPLIADSVTLMVFNNGEVGPDAFLQRAGAVTLTDAGRRSVIAAFERRMETEITHPIFGYKVSYRRILEVQCRLLARHVLGELPEYPIFVTR